MMDVTKLNSRTSRYVLNCVDLEVVPNPAIMIALSNTNVKTLELFPDQFSISDLIALGKFLENDSRIEYVKMPNCKMGASLCYVFAEVLKRNETIVKLDFSYNRLSMVSVVELLKAVSDNKTIEHIRLRGNLMHEHLCKDAAEHLVRNKTLKHLDITNNNMDMNGVIVLMEALPNCEVEFEGNFWAAEIANSITHGLGILLSFIGGYFLIQEASDRSKHPLSYLVTSWVFILSLVCLYTCSTLAHSFHRMKVTGRTLIILDHSCISILIAGSYTPFSWVSLGHTWIGPALGYTEWALALCAVFLSLQQKKYAKYELITFVFMGWLAIIPGYEFMNCMQSEGLALVAVGGLFYTVGIYFFIRGQTIPMLHAVWHFMVLGGSISHYFAVLLYCRPCVLSTDIRSTEGAAWGRMLDL
eukprot:CFRG2513T1